MISLPSLNTILESSDGSAASLLTGSASKPLNAWSRVLVAYLYGLKPPAVLSVVADNLPQSACPSSLREAPLSRGQRTSSTKFTLRSWKTLFMMNIIIKRKRCYILILGTVVLLFSSLSVVSLASLLHLSNCSLDH